MTRSIQFASALTLALAAASLNGCGDEKIANPVPQKAHVRVVHASPNAPGVDLYVDEAKVALPPLTFPLGTGYLDVPAGGRNFKVKVTGTSTTVIDATPVLAEGGSYTVFAVDSVSRIAPLVLVDTLAAPAAGKAHVRFIHLSPGAPPVDIAVTGGGVVFGNRAFKQYSALTPLPAGTYNLEVRLAGTSTVVLPLPGIQLQDGKIYTVFARGFVNGTGAQALGAQIIALN